MARQQREVTHLDPAALPPDAKAVLDRLVDAELERRALVYARTHGCSMSQARQVLASVRPKVAKHVLGRVTTMGKVRVLHQLAQPRRQVRQPLRRMPQLVRRPVAVSAPRARASRRVRSHSGKRGPPPAGREPDEPEPLAPPRQGRGISAWSEAGA
jgi:hypothetical protein